MWPGVPISWISSAALSLHLAPATGPFLPFHPCAKFIPAIGPRNDWSVCWNILPTTSSPGLLILSFRSAWVWDQLLFWIPVTFLLLCYCFVLEGGILLCICLPVYFLSSPGIYTPRGQGVFGIIIAWSFLYSSLSISDLLVKRMKKGYEGQKQQAWIDDLLVPGVTWVIFLGHGTLDLGGKRCCLLVGGLSLAVIASESSVIPRPVLAKALQPVFQVLAVQWLSELPAEHSQPCPSADVCPGPWFPGRWRWSVPRSGFRSTPGSLSASNLPVGVPHCWTGLLGRLPVGKEGCVAWGLCQVSALTPSGRGARKWTGPMGAVFSRQAGAAHGKLLTHTCGFQA